MTEYWGANNYGCAFLIDTNGTGYTDAFDFRDTAGVYPQGNLTLYGNELYGMTFKGGKNNKGTIFSVNFLTAGINELIPNRWGMKLYPNPNNGEFTIESSVVSGQASVEVYNLLGEKIYSKLLPIFNCPLSIDLGTKSPGVYLYRVITETGNLVSEGKFIIE